MGRRLFRSVVAGVSAWLVVVAPAAAGTDPAAIDRLVREAMERAGVPGMQVAVRHGEQLAVLTAEGVADFEHAQPVTASTVFPIGSITKQVTALAIAQLAAQGRLDPDDRVGDHLPQLEGRAAAEATLRQLLTHQSGLSNYTDRPELHERAWHAHSHEEMLAWFIDEPLEFPPGERWRYTNSGTYLLGMVIEAVSGMRYAEYLAQEVFEPLGMRATAYADSRMIVPGRARGYERDATGEWRHARAYDASVPFAAGTLVSTAEDLVTWTRAVLAGAAIPTEVHALITTPGELADGTRLAYTLGAFFSTAFEGRRKFSHGGQIYGYSAQLAYYPDDDLTIVVLSNRQDYRPSAVSLERRIARQVLGLPSPPVATVAASDALLAAVSGRYSTLPLSFFGLDQLVVWPREGRLMLAFGPAAEEAGALEFRYVGQGRFVALDDEEIVLRWRAGELMLEYYDLRMPLRVTEADAADPLCERVAARLASLHEQHGFPGAVMAIRTLEGRACEFAVGDADRERGWPMQPSDRMLAASIGKTLVAAVTLDLAHHGSLDLDDRVADWLGDLPGFGRLPNAGEMTVRQLLSHTSGLPDHIEDEAFLAEWSRRLDSGQPLSPQTLVAYLFDAPALFAAGSDFAYSDTGYLLLGLVVERASGQPFYRLARLRFLDPLGLSQTAPSDRRRLRGLVQGYAGGEPARGAVTRVLDDAGNLRWHPLTEWTGGGFISNARDLARWVLVHFSGASMPHDYFPLVLNGAPELARHAGSTYGLGVSTLDSPWGKLLGHTGWVPGFRSTAFFLPEQGMAYALQINTDVGLVGEGNPFLEINLAVLEAMLDESQEK